MSDERRYTLREAQRELAKEGCVRFGHDFKIVVAGDGTPQQIRCERCGRSWPSGEEKPE